MKRHCVLMIIVLYVAGGPAEGWAASKGSSATAGGAISGIVQAWALALQGQDAGRLRALLASDAAYDRVDLVGSGKVKRWGAGRATPELLFHRATEVQVTKVRSVGGEYLAVLSQVAEDGAVREWETWLTLRPGGNGWQVAHATDVAMEGTFPGDPEGCPDTGAKRREAVTLYGKLDGSESDSIIRVFQTQRNTDAWAFAAGAAKEEGKRCAPPPGLALEDLEVIVHEASGALRGYQHLGRIDRTTGGGGRGIALYTGADGGALVAGGARVYPVPGAAPLLFLARTWRSERSPTEWRAVHRVDAWRWAGDGFRKVWGFDFGKEGGHLSGEIGRVIWALKAPTPDGAIRADLASAGTSDCEGHVEFTWAGGGFKMRKEGVRGPCLGSWWPGGESGVLTMGEVNLERLAKKAEQRGAEE